MWQKIGQICYFRAFAATKAKIIHLKIILNYFQNILNKQLYLSSFSIILYELNSRQGPYGKTGLSLKQVLRKVVRFGFVHEPIYRPPIDQLLNSFDFVRDCLQEAWSECPGEQI